MRKLILALIFPVFLISCVDTEEQDVTDVFDPRVPGGTIGDNTLENLENFSINNFVTGQLTLSWEVPESYTGILYNIKIYKRDCRQGDETCVIPDPTVRYTSADIYLVHETTGSSYVDTNIVPGNFYTYWVYVNVDETRWTNEIEEGVEAKIDGVTISVPTAASFWGTRAWSYGEEELLGFVNLQTLGILPSTFESRNPFVDPTPLKVEKSGGIAYGRDGNVMYVSDTKNNRVLIYAKREALACGENDGSEVYYACLFNNQGVPYTVMNVLGQKDVAHVGSCRTTAQCSAYGDQGSCEADHCEWNSTGGTCEPRLPINACLNQPTDLFVDSNNNLIIADSGNNRVVIHEDAPFEAGCDTEPYSNVFTTYDCEADFVIGQRTRNEIGVHSITTDGQRSLDGPSGVHVSGTNLFIADTNNHRVVRVNNYATYPCGADDGAFWDANNSQCNFGAVLGQETMFERVNLFEALRDGDINIDPMGLGNNLVETDFMRRHFSNPTSIRVDDAGNLLVGAFEGVKYINGSNTNEIKSRILMFTGNPIGDTVPRCNATNFQTGSCDATKFIGQSNPASFNVYLTSGSYNDISFGLNFMPEFEVVGDTMFAVTPETNNVYIWENYKTNALSGVRYDHKVLDPAGASGVNLEGINAIKFSDDSLRLNVYDTEDPKIHELNLQF